jgi:hypothetical protein
MPPDLPQGASSLTDCAPVPGSCANVEAPGSLISGSDRQRLPVAAWGSFKFGRCQGRGGGPGLGFKSKSSAGDEQAASRVSYSCQWSRDQL